VKYLNAQPLIHGWMGPVLFDHPARLCEKLAAGELDVALVSSFEFLRNSEYAIVDDVAVAADGAVYSVFLAHRGALGAIEEIAVDPASQTSVNLLRCLLAEHGWMPRFIKTEGAATRDVTESHARLMIGDQAIRFRQQHQITHQFWDLAEEWNRLTGLPFVFALWLVRRGTPDADALANALRNLRDRNLLALDPIIADENEFSAAFCTYYLRDCLRFHFAEREKAGLLKFQSLCEKHGILPQRPHTLRLL